MSSGVGVNEKQVYSVKNRPLHVATWKQNFELLSPLPAVFHKRQWDIKRQNQSKINIYLTVSNIANVLIDYNCKR